MNLLQIPTKDANVYGRALLDALFTKSEQASGVVLKSKKSNRSPPDEAKVQLLLGMCISL